MKLMISVFALFISVQTSAASEAEDIYSSFKGSFCDTIVARDESTRVDLVDACTKSKNFSDLYESLSDLIEKCQKGPRETTCKSDVEAVKNLRLAYIAGARKANALCKDKNASEDSIPQNPIRKGSSALKKVSSGSGTP